MAIKTPQEIAAEQMAAFTVDDGDVQECSAGYIHEQIVAAIEADRKQRTHAARTWRAADRPAGIVRGWGDVLITRVNSRSVYFRAPNVLGELASPISDLIEIRGA